MRTAEIQACPPCPRARQRPGRLGYLDRIPWTVAITAFQQGGRHPWNDEGEIMGSP